MGAKFIEIMRLFRSLPILFALLVTLLTSNSWAASSLAEKLQPFVAKQELAGAVTLVADKDRVLAVETVGFANLDSRKPMAPDTLFWIASQSKPITSVAVMMLVDEGRIALDDAVEKYLPEFRAQMVAVEKDTNHMVLRRPAHPVTVREVLSHMSGMPFQSSVEAPTRDGLPLASAVRSYAITPLLSEPGTRYEYSNAGINTAARILEVVSGIPYEAFMQKRVFDPLGMKDTTFWPNDRQLRRLATSYRPDPSKTRLVEFRMSQLGYPLDDRIHRFPMPAGGLFSTARDTARFCQMMLNGGVLEGRRYLTPAAFQEMTRRQTPATAKESYGLGFQMGADWFGHGGANATTMEIHPSKGLVMVWLVQHGGFLGDGAKAQGVFKSWAAEQFAPRPH